MRDGDKIIIRNAKDESTGQVYNLTVAQYIAYDLDLINLCFSNPIFTQMLNEAVEHSGEEGLRQRNTLPSMLI